MRKIFLGQAIREAFIEEMKRDENVIILGEDMGVMGSVFGLTKGLMEEFGEHRVIDTPISENGFTTMAVGAAMRGIRPVVELMYIDFATTAMDALVNQAAKMRYMTGGKVKVPMVVRAPGGCGRRNAAQHSQSLEAWFTHTPGLKVIAPSCAYDAKGLMKSAIRDDDPVLCVEHKLLYATKGEVPEEEYVIPLGVADIKREGSDVTVIAWSRQVNFAIEAADKLAKEGISVEVIDLRSLVPLDFEAIAKSIKKTHRVVIAQEAPMRGGFAGELSAQIQEKLFDYLDAPVKRVASANVVIPFSPVLEDAIFPKAPEIMEGIKEVMYLK